MARMKPVGPGKKPDYRDFLEKSKKYMSNPDRKDYARTIAGRGDTHALDGGEVAKKQMPKKKQRLIPKTPAIKSWQDRNLDNRGSKLNP